MLADLVTFIRMVLTLHLSVKSHQERMREVATNKTTEPLHNVMMNDASSFGPLTSSWFQSSEWMKWAAKVSPFCSRDRRTTLKYFVNLTLTSFVLQAWKSHVFFGCTHSAVIMKQTISSQLEPLLSNTIFTSDIVSVWDQAVPCLTLSSFQLAPTFDIFAEF